MLRVGKTTKIWPIFLVKFCQNCKFQNFENLPRGFPWPKRHYNFEFQGNRCKNSWGNVRKPFRPQTTTWTTTTDGHGESNIPPYKLRWAGGIKKAWQTQTHGTRRLQCCMPQQPLRPTSFLRIPPWRSYFLSVMANSYFQCCILVCAAWGRRSATTAYMPTLCYNLL